MFLSSVFTGIGGVSGISRVPYNKFVPGVGLEPTLPLPEKGF
jgi:hypothetical protein